MSRQVDLPKARARVSDISMDVRPGMIHWLATAEPAAFAVPDPPEPASPSVGSGVRGLLDEELLDREGCNFPDGVRPNAGAALARVVSRHPSTAM
jgi:hypothetical protein